MKFANLVKVMMLAVVSVGMVNCSKGGKSSNTNNSSGYYVSNSTCYYNGVAQASLNSCVSAAGTYYAYQGAYCYQIGNGMFQQVSTNLCANSTTSTGYAQMCSGYYTDGVKWAMCTEGATGVSYQGSVVVLDCSGYRLYNQSGQLVTCQ